MAYDTRHNILILNGPNLNLLGRREPEIYGRQTLEDIEQGLRAKYRQDSSVALHFYQSNSEGTLIDKLHSSMETMDGVVFNPGAYTHTSVALRDAISSIALPVIEVHLSNIHARESFRHKSYISGVALGVICGLGISGYGYALDALIEHLLCEQR